MESFGGWLEIEPYDYFCYVTTEPLSPWPAHQTYGQRAHLGNLDRGS
jgi:hypothetical protein